MLLGLPEPTGEQATVIAAPLEPLAALAVMAWRRLGQRARPWAARPWALHRAVPH
jgi:hypothetical protein